MKSRWLLNVILLLLVAGIALFLYLRPKPVEQAVQEFSVSKLDPNSFSRMQIDVPGRKPVIFEKQQGRWYMTEPFSARADVPSIGRVVSIVNATTREKLPAADLARFGLDNPSIKVRIDDHEFSFGMYHPVNGEQFVAYKDSVYVLPTVYSEGAATPPLEMLEKRPLEPADEVIAGFDFSGLEQWESVRLNLDMQPDGKWKVNPEKAKPSQDEINEWFANNWTNLIANTVEPYTLDDKPHPFVTLKLKNGKSLRLIKMQESPELLLVREDQKMMYHFPQDVGFEALNPPVGYKPE